MILKLNPAGNDYVVKTGKAGNRHSGPTGRKAKPFNVLRRNLADIAKHYTKVLWCSDSHGNR